MTTTHPSSTKQDILQYLLKQGQATAPEIARFLGLSSQGIRRHLNDLEKEGILERQLESLPLDKKTGRPGFIYSLTKEARDRFPQRYGEFAVSFLDTLVETVGEQQVREVLQKQWQRKAAEYREKMNGGSLEDRIDKLAKIRREEGYMTEIYPLEPINKDHSTPSKFFLAEHNCAISEVAQSYPSVCGHELEMFSAILPDCKVERTQWINEGENRCGYLIQKAITH